MSRKSRFQVNSRLASLLSQEYSSTERALKELVDNGWDADATKVDIALPAPMSTAPIVIEDNGSGMSADEVERHYLNIAADRRELRGPRTAKLKRQVKGRKGVGKFAGLMAAAHMKLETRKDGLETSFEFNLSQLAAARDIEQLDIALKILPCKAELRGTTITLTDLHTGYEFPNAVTLKQLLIQEYGREQNFTINVDGKPLGVDDVQGLYKTFTEDVEGVGRVVLRFAIPDKKSASRKPGILVRVQNKPVGNPYFFGLEEQEDIPQKLIRRLYGEVDADGLSDFVTDGWSSLVENSVLLERVNQFVRPKLAAAIQEKFGREIQLARARLQRQINLRLAKLPEYRRRYAEEAIQKILTRSFDEPPEKIENYVFVLLEAIERSEYGSVLGHLAEAKRSDVAAIAESLDEFGMVDMAYLVNQAKARMDFLDMLDELVANPKTLEAEIHKALEKSLWVLGTPYSLFTSNKTIQRLVEDDLAKSYTGTRATLRPDLLATEDLHGECLLIEFKRPSHALNYDDYTQVTRYRHELRPFISKPIKVLVIGGQVSSDFPVKSIEDGVRPMSFHDVISTARRELEWKLRTEG
jgi:hypothetical protein